MTAESPTSDSTARRFFHGTRASPKQGDLIQPGYASNFTERKSSWVYVSETLNAATWGAETHLDWQGHSAGDPGDEGRYRGQGAHRRLSCSLESARVRLAFGCGDA